MTLSSNAIWQMKLKHAIPHKWKTNIKENHGNVTNFLIQNHPTLTFACSKSIVKTLGKGVKYVQS